jgi:hypothetical protein
MKKKIYEKPSLVVVELQHKYQILAGSLPAAKGFTVNPEDITWDPDDLDDEDDLR